MTNKPMLSVERELIERSVQAIINTSQMQPALDELRALLDAPEKQTIEGYEIPHLNVCVSCGGKFAEIKNSSCALLATAYYVECTSCAAKTAGYDKAASAVEQWNAEPSAQHQDYPVNRLTYSKGDRRYVNGWNDACSHWEEKIAPVAVVMPERMNLRSSDGSETYETKSWNAALDAVARLNGVTQ